MERYGKNLSFASPNRTLKAETEGAGFDAVSLQKFDELRDRISNRDGLHLSPLLRLAERTLDGLQADTSASLARHFDPLLSEIESEATLISVHQALLHSADLYHELFLLSPIQASRIEKLYTSLVSSYYSAAIRGMCRAGSSFESVESNLKMLGQYCRMEAGFWAVFFVDFDLTYGLNGIFRAPIATFVPAGHPTTG